MTRQPSKSQSPSKVMMHPKQRRCPQVLRCPGALYLQAGASMSRVWCPQHWAARQHDGRPRTWLAVRACGSHIGQALRGREPRIGLESLVLLGCKGRRVDASPGPGLGHDPVDDPVGEEIGHVDSKGPGSAGVEQERAVDCRWGTGCRVDRGRAVVDRGRAVVDRGRAVVDRGWAVGEVKG